MQQSPGSVVSSIWTTGTGAHISLPTNQSGLRSRRLTLHCSPMRMEVFVTLFAFTTFETFRVPGWSHSDPGCSISDACADDSESALARTSRACAALPSAAARAHRRR